MNASSGDSMLMCLQKHYLHHVQIPLQTDKLLYKSYYSMWINHAGRFTGLESWKRKSALDSTIFGIHNHPVLRKWRKEYLHVRVSLVFTICSNIHTHHRMHNTHTHTLALTRKEIPKQDTVTANQIYFWEKERKLCCCRQLCYRLLPDAPGFMHYQLLAHTLEAYFLLYTVVVVFIATTSSIS